MPLTILMYGDWTSYNGQIRKNVGLYTYRGVGLVRLHCNITDPSMRLHLEFLC